MNQSPPQPRRWFQFSLRTLFVIVAICCIGMGWLGWELHIVQSRKALLNWIADTHCYYVTDDFAEPAQVSWIRRLLGDHEITGIELLESTDVKQLERIKAAFPEAQIRLWPEMPAGGFF